HRRVRGAAPGRGRREVYRRRATDRVADRRAVRAEDDPAGPGALDLDRNVVVAPLDPDRQWLEVAAPGRDELIRLVAPEAQRAEVGENACRAEVARVRQVDGATGGEGEVAAPVADGVVAPEVLVEAKLGAAVLFPGEVAGAGGRGHHAP